MHLTIKMRMCGISMRGMQNTQRYAEIQGYTEIQGYMGTHRGICRDMGPRQLYGTQDNGKFDKQNTSIRKNATSLLLLSSLSSSSQRHFIMLLAKTDATIFCDLLPLASQTCPHCSNIALTIHSSQSPHRFLCAPLLMQLHSYQALCIVVTAYHCRKLSAVFSHS